MYDPEYQENMCEQVIALGSEGKSEVQIAAALGVARTTMRSWAENFPIFSSALARARDLSQVWWENQAQDGLKDKSFNAALWMKCVASRFRDEYGERVKQEITGANGAPLIPEPRDELDLARWLALQLAIGAEKSSEGEPPATDQES